jgi:sRNA-binding protein
MARKTEAQLIADLEAKLAERKAKAEEKAKAAEAKAEDKAKADADRITKTIERKTEQRDALNTEIAELSLKLAGIDVEVVEAELELQLEEV